MMTPENDSQAALRRGVYALLIAIATGAMLGRILAVDAVDRTALEAHLLKQIPRDLKDKAARDKAAGKSPAEIESLQKKAEAEWTIRAHQRRPFLSANDRSRWCTVRALVEPDMRVEGAPYAIDRVIQQPNWDTIDMVKHDGHYYSSKPTLLPTLMAGAYWVIYKTTGATLGTHPFEIGRQMLVLFQVLPMTLGLVVLSKLVERFGRTDWGRIFAMAAASCGTFLTTFAVTMNNHTLGAVCAVVALYAAVRIAFDDDRRLIWFALAGLFGALTAADELPALALLAALGVGLLWKAPVKTLLVFVPGAAVIAAGFFGTNWIAHRSLKPAYMHRSDTNPQDNWYEFTIEQPGKKPVKSYWSDPKGVDRGEPSKATYALHALVGHHGIFSLTPVWLLTVAGLGIWLVRPDDRRLRSLALLIASVTLVLLAFYLFYLPARDRNYGGMSSGLRWMFWLAPLWIVGMLPCLDAMARHKWARGLALVMLTLSVLSASYPIWNPWTHPWLLDWFQYRGWIRV
jgi:hypothetical protein